MDDVLDNLPEPMRCEDCGTRWYSRVASVVTTTQGLGRCAFCGGVLRLEGHLDVATAAGALDEDPPVIDPDAIPGLRPGDAGAPADAEPDPGAEPEPA